MKTWKSIKVRVLIVRISSFSFCSSVKVLDRCVKELIVLGQSYCISKASDKGGNFRIFKTTSLKEILNGLSALPTSKTRCM